MEKKGGSGMEYNQRFKILLEKVAQKEGLEAKQRGLRQQQTRLQAQVRELAETLEKEQLDVQRMERTSLTSIFYAVMGKKEEALDREKAEAYAAKLKYDAAAQQLQGVEEDLARVEARLEELAACEREYEQLLREKTEVLKASGSQEAQQILRLEQEIAQQQSRKQEIQEAMSAGYRALNSAQDVLSSLDSAKNWGTFDLMGGGMLADMAKHSRLDEAQDKVVQLQDHLRRFQTELADVWVDENMQVNVEGFLRFADYFFDNLFVDWAVLDKIKQSQANVRDTIQEIERVMEDLRGMDQATYKRLSQLEKEKDTVVVNANL